VKAVVYNDYGDSSVLHLEDVRAPQPAADEVLIQVKSAGVNPIDTRLRRGELRGLLPGGFPRIPGYDVSGVVESVGKAAPFQPGERVLAFLDHIYGGGYAEYATSTHTSVVRIPEEMPFDDAAAIPLAGSTALQSLRDFGHVKAGDQVLIVGASGGVGAFAVQIAKSSGASVTAVASGKHEAFVRDLGADEFIDYHSEDFTQANRQWNIIFDVAGKSSFRQVAKVLGPNGNYVSTEPSIRGLLVGLMTWPLHKQGTCMLARSRSEDLLQLVAMYREQTLRVQVSERFGMEDASQAHHLIETGSFPGKLVLNTNQSSTDAIHESR
jgi:NADPH:quinone reductase-like Zn-dependent oxidoreductase